MRPSNTAVVALFAVGVGGDFTRGGLSFPSTPCASARRRTCRLRTQGFVRCNPLLHVQHQHIAEHERRASRVRPGGSNKATRRHGRTCSIGASTELHASLDTPSASSSAGLPLLDLPGIAAAAAVSSKASSGGGGGGGRSRRGKYPVVELYRRDLDGSSAAIDDGEEEEKKEEDDSFGEDGLRPRRAAAAGGGPRGAGATAMEHLTSVLRLGSEQSDLMLESFPALADVHPDRLDLHAKLCFLRHTIGGDGATVAVSFPQFFGHPLERHIAPRHAFLVASGRPSGARLLESGCRGLRRMLELPANRFVAEMVPGREMSDYCRFEQAFRRGPFDAARKGEAGTLRLLRSHGWDCWETDRRGRTALFWAAGGGSVDACVALVEGEGGLRPQDSGGDGSTPLHWAAAGVETRRFGTGGHVNVCRWLLSLGADPGATTTEGNTVVMWAAWAGGLDATRWAVEEAGADLSAANANGCTVAHWASSGGDEAVCRYLHSKGVDFTRQNKGGNDPLSHAVAYGRRDIAAWLLAAEEREGEGEGEGEASSSSGGGGRAGGAGSGTEGAGQRTRRRRDDPHLLDLARLTGDEKMQEFLLEGT